MASAEDDAIMARFISDYLGLLDGRVSAIQTGLRARNDMDAEVAMLSLESASTMVGAPELAKIVRQMRKSLERGDRSDLPILVQAMRAEAGSVPGRLLGVSRR